MKTGARSLGLSAVITLAALLAVVPIQAQAAPGWHGHIPEEVTRLRPVEDYPATNNLRLSVGLPLRNREALTNFIGELYDPSTTNYHHYLTPEQFADRFGPTREDYQKTIDYLTAHGFRVTATHSNRMIVSVLAAAADAQKTFHTRLRYYRHPTENRNFFAPESTPWIDDDVPVQDVMGLDNYVVPHPMSLRRPKNALTNYLEQGSGPNGTYMGKDFRTAYVPGVTNTGSGQYVGLMEFGPYWPNDVPTYESTAGLSNIVISNIFLDGVTEPPSSGTDAGEQALDMEMSMSMAPGATILYYGGEVVDDILGRMASDNLAKQLSCSFGFGIDSTSEQLYQEFIVQGQNYFVASGDAGAYVGTINPPAAEPYCTYCGGTALYTASPGGKWTNELAWVGSGGGVSTFYAIPNYQQGINMTPLYGSSTMRNFPDVSMMADTVIFIAANNGTGAVGGTSCSTPLWAGFYALANQQAASLGQTPIGFFNPILYAIGKSSSYSSCFHDVTSGNTTNYSSGTNRFFAAAGYDLATGWGSPTGSNLINALTGVGTNNFMLYASPSALNVTAGGSATVQLASQAMNQFSGTVGLSASGLPSGVTASFNPDSTSSNSILTLNVGATAAAGTNTVTLTGISGSVTQTTAITLVVVGATSGTSQASLSSSYNRTAFYTDGSTFSGGADNGGNAYSANLLGSSLSWNGCLFTLGPANASDAVQCAGQTITLPSGQYTSLQMLATAVDGTQTTRPFIVTYTDGSTAMFSQSLSDWTSPQNYPGETVVSANAYRDTGGGTPDILTRVFVYGYSFSLNNNKTVRSIQLPNDGNILVFAITVANDFKLYGAPLSFVLTAGGKAAGYLAAGPVSGFSGNVNLSVSGLPAGVTASFSPASASSSSILTLTASATAAPSNATLTVIGTASGVTHNMNLNLSVTTPIPGATSVSLSSAFNIFGIVSDGLAFSGTHGMDSAGNAYSSTLLSSAPNWDGCLFTLGSVNGADAVACGGQTIALPSGQYPALLLLGTAVNSSQPNQVFEIAYTDGTTASVTQSFSVWTASQNYANESVAFASGYSDNSGGTENTSKPVNLYGYFLSLNDSKTVQSVTLPNNTNVILLAANVGNASTRVPLSFNRAGIFGDGVDFNGGADSDGNAYSSNLLGSSQVWDSVQFVFGSANANDMVECGGQSVSLPANRYTTLLVLGMGVNGSQTSQPFVVNYADGSKATNIQSLSDWANYTSYSNQFIASAMSYRDNGGGGEDGSTSYLYGYLFPLNNTKTVQSLSLPNNNNIDILALALANTPLPVSLQSNYNLAGIYTDGSKFTNNGGLDNDGNAYSATQLGASQTWHNMPFFLGPPNATNVVSATGQTISLPPGQYSSLLMLATAVNGSQTSQSFVVHYTNGTISPFTQSISDWASSQGYSGETIVTAMPYRDSSGGSEVSPSVNLYGYVFALNSNNVAQSITLPNNNKIEVVAMTLSNYTAALPEAPAITSQPQSLTVTNGNAASFSVTATGSPPLHYQWWTNGVALANGGGFAGVTTNVLTLSSATANAAASYTVVVNNTYGSITSSVATLFVGVPPAIANQPLSLTVSNGSAAQFSVGVSGTTPLTYQWQRNQTNLSDGGNIAGSSSALLTLNPAGAFDAASYDVIVTNSFGNTTSVLVQLNVVFAFQTAAQVSGAFNFSWATTPGETYQVQYTGDLSSGNWTNLGAAILATNPITSDADLLGPDQQRFYRVVQQ